MLVLREHEEGLYSGYLFLRQSHNFCHNTESGGVHVLEGRCCSKLFKSVNQRKLKCTSIPCMAPS